VKSWLEKCLAPMEFLRVFNQHVISFMYSHCLWLRVKYETNLGEEQLSRCVRDGTVVALHHFPLGKPGHTHLSSISNDSIDMDIRGGGPTRDR
jgi:hypothetical protein